MFLHLSVILFTGGKCTPPGRHHFPPVDTPFPRQTPPGRHTPPGQTLPGKHPNLGRHPLPHLRDGHCSGLYTSYWNAFLFVLFLTLVCCHPGIKKKHDFYKFVYLRSVCTTDLESRATAKP